MIVNILANILKHPGKYFENMLGNKLEKHLLAPNIVSISAVSETSQSWRKYFVSESQPEPKIFSVPMLKKKVEMYFS